MSQQKIYWYKRIRIWWVLFGVFSVLSEAAVGQHLVQSAFAAWKRDNCWFLKDSDIEDQSSLRFGYHNKWVRGAVFARLAFEPLKIWVYFRLVQIHYSKISQIFRLPLVKKLLWGDCFPQLFCWGRVDVCLFKGWNFTHIYEQSICLGVFAGHDDLLFEPIPGEGKRFGGTDAWIKPTVGV